MKKKLLAFGLIVVGSLTLAGCGISEGSETSSNYPATHFVFEQQMPDGSFVTCIWAKSGYGGGLACDFD